MGRNRRCRCNEASGYTEVCPHCLILHICFYFIIVNVAEVSLDQKGKPYAKYTTISVGFRPLCHHQLLNKNSSHLLGVIGLKPI